MRSGATGATGTTGAAGTAGTAGAAGLLCAAVAAAAWCSSAGAAEEVKLTVDAGAVQLAGPVPVRSGIPLARGALKSAANCRVLSAGREIDSQARALAKWPDGSVKWLLLDFLAKGGDEVTVQYGARVRPRRIRRPLTAGKKGDDITVDTGVVRFTVRRNGTAFIDELELDTNGDGRYGPGEKVIRAPAAGEERYFLDYLHRPRGGRYTPFGNCMAGAETGRSKVEITELRLEESGPLRCVILVRGRHLVAKLAERIADRIKYEGRSEFTVRIHAFRGSGEIRAAAHFVIDGVPDDDFVKAWGLRLPVGGGMKLTTHGGEGPVAVTPLGAAPFVALTQDSADSFRVWTAAADRTGASVVSSGARAGGWVDLSNDTWGVTVGIRRFWEKWPNAIHYDAERGELSAMLYPPECVPMDVRRYARYEWGVGETGAPDMPLSTLAPVAAKGIANTKVVRLVFHRGPVDDDAAAGGHGAFDVRPIAKARAAHYSSTLALGHYAPRVEGRHEQFERETAAFVDFFARGQKEFRWYGMWDYGDFQQRRGDPGKMNSHRHGRWENDWGRWGWAQNDGAGRHCKVLLLQFLRTGERKYFELGEAMVRHQTDVDFLETREFPWDFSAIRKIPPERTRGPWWDVRGCSHRHGVQHWSCGYVGARGGNVVGHRIYYYLTGDGRAHDVLDILAEAGLVKFGLGGREQILQRLGHSGGQTGQAATTGAIFYAWERTGDDVYRDALKKLVANGGSYGAAFGGLDGLVGYYECSGDEALKKRLVEMARSKIEYSKRRRKVWSWPQSSIAIVIAGYRLTGDAELGELLAKMIVGGSEMRGKGVNANYIIEMPYAIEALRMHGGN